MDASLEQLTAPAPPAFELEALSLLDTFTVAELLACSPRTVINLITRGQLPALRLGANGAYRIHPDALTAFIERHGHHEPHTVANSTSPGTLPAFTPASVALRITTTPDGLRLVTLPPPPDLRRQD